MLGLLPGRALFKLYHKLWNITSVRPAMHSSEVDCGLSVTTRPGSVKEPAESLWALLCKVFVKAPHLALADVPWMFQLTVWPITWWLIPEAPVRLMLAEREMQSGCRCGRWYWPLLQLRWLGFVLETIFEDKILRLSRGNRKESVQWIPTALCWPLSYLRVFLSRVLICCLWNNYPNGPLFLPGMFCCNS